MLTQPHYCPACDSPHAVLLGVLGNRCHLRCRNCGIDHSHPVEDLDSEYDAEEEFEYSQRDED